MGYRCPVCGDPQADDVHLANHLAFTALVRGGDHEAWLDEHVPDWGTMGESTLAPQVSDRAEPAEYPAVFEDTTDGGREHDREGSSHGHTSETAREALPETADLSAGGPTDEETRAVLDRARELTRQRRADAADDAPNGDGDGDES
jgi:hypothetical protein